MRDQKSIHFGGVPQNWTCNGGEVKDQVEIKAREANPGIASPGGCPFDSGRIHLDNSFWDWMGQIGAVIFVIVLVCMR